MTRDHLSSSPGPEKMLAEYGQRMAPSPRRSGWSSSRMRGPRRPRQRSRIELVILAGVIAGTGAIVVAAVRVANDVVPVVELTTPLFTDAPPLTAGPVERTSADTVSPSLSDVEVAGETCFTDFTARSPGDNASCDFLYGACDTGDLAAWELARVANAGSELEYFGATCGGREPDRSKAGSCR